MSNYDTCVHCGNILRHSEQPCPTCGEYGRQIYMYLTDGISVSDDHAVTATNGKTNRSILHCDTLNPTDTVKIERLVRSFIDKPSISELRKYIRTHVNNFNTPALLKEKIFFRGVDISVKDKLTSSRIGPSPNALSGRYNCRGEQCLYLADNKKFIFHELKSDKILIQKYKITVSDYKIADVSAKNKTLHNNIALLFDLTERGRTSSGYNFEQELDNKKLSKYLISQIIASYFKNSGWDGLYIPGVHGENGTTYNLIIFDSIVDQWEDWTEDSYFEMEK